MSHWHYKERWNPGQVWFDRRGVTCELTPPLNYEHYHIWKRRHVEALKLRYVRKILGCAARRWEQRRGACVLKEEEEEEGAPGFKPISAEQRQCHSAAHKRSVPELRSAFLSLCISAYHHALKVCIHRFDSASVAFVRMLSARMSQQPWFYSDKRNIRLETCCGECQLSALNFFKGGGEEKRDMLLVVRFYLIWWK